MMRKFLSFLAIAALSALPATALAGESCYRCTNQCPLAKQANERRSQGTEAARTAPSMREITVRMVAENLEKI